MSNYLSQIAARNAGAGMPLLTPGHAPVETALNDPFSQAETAPGETGRAAEATPTATITPAASRDIMTPQPASDPLVEATAPEKQETITPVYLSKYIERNHYYTREQTNTVITKEPGNKETLRAAAESPVLSIFPAVQNSTATTNDRAAKQTATPQKTEPVQQQRTITTTELVPGQQSSMPEKFPTIHEQPALLQPVERATHQEAKPVLLQPPVPVQPDITPQKDKPVPALVIGKITVEIVPAQKPVNKIINHVVKPQPVATPSTTRNKNSFGLGQL